MNYFIGFCFGVAFCLALEMAREQFRLKRLKKWLDGQEETDRLLHETFEKENGGYE